MSSNSPPDSEPFHWHYAEFDDSNFQIRGRTVFFIIVVFSILIFIILLFLYSKWVCRVQIQSPTTTSAAVQLVHAPPQGLDAAAIGKLPIVLHKSAEPFGRNLSQLECSICLGVFQDGEKVKFLPECHHCYHCECVDKWLITQSSCPLCRASLRVDSVV